MTLSHGSAFSGLGGAEVAAELAGGYEPAWMIEFAPYQHALLERRYPGVHVEWDVRTASVPGVDVMTGGFPCQPFSVAGRRGGDSDERNMWPATGQLIRRVRPRVALLENVPALRNPHGREPAYFGTVLGDLAALGYDASWDCVPASRVGAPHRRDRVWIVAWDRSRVEPFDPFVHYRAGAAPVGAMWPSPVLGDATGGRTSKGAARPGEGGLRVTVQDAMWATPTAQQPGGTAERFLERKQEARERGASMGVSLTDLQMQAQEAMWPTPRASENENRTTKPAPSHGDGHGRVLAGEVHAAMWPTPRESEWKGTGPLGSGSQAHRLEHGYLDATVQEATRRSGVLNPEWVELLMGYPRGWTDADAEPSGVSMCAWPSTDLRVGDVDGTNPDYAQHWLGPEGGPWPLAPRTKATTPRLSALGQRMGAAGGGAHSRRDRGGTRMRRPSREAVLTTLGDEEQTPAVIAQRLGSSPSAVQRQLIELEAEGRVTHGISNRGVTWRKVVGV